MQSTVCRGGSARSELAEKQAEKRRSKLRQRVSSDPKHKEIRELKPLLPGQFYTSDLPFPEQVITYVFIPTF